MGLCGEQPDIPDPNEAFAAGVRADLETLPARRRIEALAQLGQAGNIDLNGRIIPVDFTGLGEGEYQRRFADQMAQQLLALQRELGPEFVQQRLEELQRADPEGFAMRRELWDRIRTGVEEARTGTRPAADALQASILAELKRGGELPESVARRVSQDVLGQQVGRGNWLGNAPAQEEAGAVAGAAEAHRAQRQAQALQFLTSGTSPADVRQREEQQGLANLGAFIAGETPQAQFGQLSGAQAGAVPWNPGNTPLPGTNPNAGPNGINFANGLYAGQVNLAQAQVNPWMAGLAGGLQGANIWASLGGGQARPFPNVNAGWAGPAANQGFDATPNWGAGVA